MNGTVRTTIMLTVDDNACHVCRKCLARETCRGNAIRVIDRGEAPFVDMSRCWGCLVCVEACPFGAIVRHEIRPAPACAHAYDPRAERLKLLEREYDELNASLPAHSLPAAHLMRLEELEDEIAVLRAALNCEAGGETESGEGAG